MKDAVIARNIWSLCSLCTLYFVHKTRSCTVTIKKFQHFQFSAHLGLRNGSSFTKVVADWCHEFFLIYLLGRYRRVPTKINHSFSSKHIYKKWKLTAISSYRLCSTKNRRLSWLMPSRRSVSLYIVWKLVKIFGFQIDLDKENIPACIYLLKVNIRNTRTRCEICSKLTIKAS